MISGWILSIDSGTQQLYRLDTGRAPFVIDAFSQYAGPGTARPFEWGGGDTLGGHRTLAWILTQHATEDNRLADYLTFAVSTWLAGLDPKRTHFLTDEMVGQMCYDLMENLYGTLDVT